MKDIKLLLITAFITLSLSCYPIEANNISEITVAPLPKSKLEFDIKYLNQSKPVIFKGVASSWKSSNWDLGFFEQNFPEVEVSVQTKENLTGQYGPVEAIYSEKNSKNI